MKWLISVTLAAGLLLGCIAPKQEAAAPKPIETWAIVIAPDVAERVFGYTLDTWVYDMLTNLRLTYAPYRINFYLTHEIPLEGNCIELGEGTMQDIRIVGNAGRIDEWNTGSDRLINANGLGVFINHLQMVWMLSYGHDMTDVELRMVMAHVVAHEIGHVLGLYHVHSMDPYVMTIWRLDEFAHPKFLKWSPQSKTYLEKVLGLRE